ncbi:MAG: hypothetical protein JO256_03255 [Alphaproteobacteria bacterium]|nr:hypothetical protein [Alphaproteobacteria bacterium]
MKDRAGAILSRRKLARRLRLFTFSPTLPAMKLRPALLIGLLIAAPAAAQDMSGMAMPPMAGMSMDGMAMTGMTMTGALGAYPMTRDASGTSWQPQSAEHHGLHVMAGDWMLMAHATLWGIYDSQSGPRGGDEFFAPGMVMAMAGRDFGGDKLSFRAMLSPDPFMGKSGYPLLLASGETANGTTPLLDRQHPHDLFMELSATYAHSFAQDQSAFLYFGYPGEPALGPPAFMHRASGMDIPQAPITHHWLDSTHVTFGVVTAGWVAGDWKLEVSQFTGREPDQNRFDLDAAKFDSTALRATFNPDPHWSLQASWGFLKSPEQLDPTVNENRFTASASYVTNWGEGQSLAATFGWGLKDLSDGRRLNGIFAEAAYHAAPQWTAFGRAEWEQNDELDSAGKTRAVGDLTLGGLYDFALADHVRLGLGASYTFDFVPGAITPSYGADPHGTMLFTRLSLQ